MALEARRMPLPHALGAAAGVLTRNLVHHKDALCS